MTATTCTIITVKSRVLFNTSHLEAQVGFVRLLKKGIFGPYVLRGLRDLDGRNGQIYLHQT